VYERETERERKIERDIKLRTIYLAKVGGEKKNLQFVFQHMH
jgi:hypothetical protein